ncbi:MAG: Rha family transcriptional regulator [Gallionellaceae bacterium]|jgi:Rha family phage regulatory protein
MFKAIARPQLTVVNGHATTTSKQIAEHFGKQHKDVLRAIESLECTPEFRQRNFTLTSYEVSQPNGGTRKLPAYTITRDGFVFLAMGFTGKEAAQWKEAYITAFNAMEAELSKPAAKATLLPAAIHLNRDAMHHINKRAWQLAQVAYEDFRERMQHDVMVKGGHTKPEDWQPEETRREVLQEIEVAAQLMEVHAKVLRNRGKRLATMVEENYGQAVRKFTR